MMRNKPAIFLALIVVLGLASDAWSQNPITADSPFQVRYMANLNAGDSFVNISNSGASGGNLCVNVYALAPDEQLIACCSCVVTPDALVSLSGRNDLISNTLTPAVPSSIVVKLLATTGGACNAAAPGTPATGLLAWGTTIHPQITTTTTSTPNTSSSCQKYCNPVKSGYTSYCEERCAPKTTTITTSTYATTETPFTPATLSTAETAELSAFCGFIQANGSGYGICRSCRLGGQVVER